VIKCVKASFITSAPSMKEAPPPIFSEIAFLGRSNVGKSSLLNSLIDRKNLAKISSTPGKTKLINFFDIEYKDKDEVFPLRFIDLPGFGYAKASKTIKNHWQKNLTNFIQNRDSIKVFVLLKDARHPYLKIDEEAKEFIKSVLKADQKLLLVFTKIDKLKQKELVKIKKEFKDAIFVSNTKKKGIDELKIKILKRVFG